VVGRANRHLGASLRSTLRDADNVTVYLYATVTEIVPDASAQHVHHLRVTMDGQRKLDASAGLYVLAAGGLDNPRLLLTSASVQPEGLGNRHGLVGRFFANHVSVSAGELRPTVRARGLAFFTAPLPHGAGETRAFLGVSAEAQRRSRLLNVAFHLRRLPALGSERRPSWEPELERHVLTVAAEVDCLVAEVRGRAVEAPTRRQPALALEAVVEQAPNPESRVTLDTERDRLGLPRVVLDWRLGALERETVRRAADLVARDMGAAGLGRVRVTEGDDPDFRAESFHHMGTTRMHADPGRGVVDPSCRVHGVDNLYVAGSSVFPTYGIANPTFTILALAFRLCDHLRTLG
jgi:choline dehydrogenase-like flavoprotein